MTIDFSLRGSLVIVGDLWARLFGAVARQINRAIQTKLDLIGWKSSGEARQWPSHPAPGSGSSAQLSLTHQLRVLVAFE